MEEEICRYCLYFTTLKLYTAPFLNCFHNVRYYNIHGIDLGMISVLEFNTWGFAKTVFPSCWHTALCRFRYPSCISAGCEMANQDIAHCPSEATSDFSSPNTPGDRQNERQTEDFLSSQNTHTERLITCQGCTAHLTYPLWVRLMGVGAIHTVHTGLFGPVLLLEWFMAK